MKAIILCALAVFSTSQAFAQTTATTSISNLSASQVLDANGKCLAGGVTGITVSGTTISLTGASAAACGSTTGGQVATVNVTWPAATYSSGSPTVSWNSTASVPCTASVSPSLGTPTASGTSTTFSAPPTPAAGTVVNYVFSLSCTAPTGYTSVSILPSSTSTMSVGAVNTGSGSGNTACLSTQTSDTTPVLSRQCSGSITYYGGTVSPYSGSFTELTDILSSPSYRYGTFMNLYSGVTMIANVNSGSYASFAITPTSTGSIQLANNQSWGDGGLISLSTKPGQFTLGNPSVICMQNTGAGNSMIFSTVAGSQCQMEVGTTYWVNFADVVLSTGDELCFQRARNSCAGGTSKISYVVYTSRTQ